MMVTVVQMIIMMTIFVHAMLLVVVLMMVVVMMIMVFLFCLAECPLTWRSHSHSTVVVSSTKAKFIAISWHAGAINVGQKMQILHSGQKPLDAL